MMVARPTSLFKTPPGSRGTSPSRKANNNNNKSNGAQPPSPVNKTRSLSKTLPSSKNVGSSPELRRKFLQDKPMRSRGNSPAKLRNSLPRSRGSETGSIEKLDETNNMQRIITSFNQAEDNINVVVRVRPLNNKELKAGDSFIIQFPGNGQILCDGIPGGPSGGQKPKLFSYNVVFEPAATQEDVLQFSGVKRLIEMAVEGFRCTAFCYGQTGSGKTHTLTGPPGLFGIRPAPYSDNHGLVFRSFLYLFQLIQEKPDVHFILKASFLEIYNEKVIDLLNPGTTRKPLAVRWSKKARGFFVENLFTVDCEELDDLIAVLEEGMRNRSVGRHNMNDYSSRSHTILTVHITSEQPAEGGVFLSRSGKINFVDLAGSEMTKKTQSEGKTLEEANNINKSLMVLGYCISSLSDSKRKNSHIPYRDSKLTKLLADSLAGNGVTLMIACISPAKSNLSETINTLRYAARAKKIRTKPVVLMDPREALILTLKREVTVLQSENEHLRSALNVYSESSSTIERRIIATPPHVDLEKLAELEGPQLAELVRLYITENEALRKENNELYTSRETLLRDQELVCRENERLLKKLEEVNSVCCRSPLIPARPAFSAEMLSGSVSDLDLQSKTNIWTSPEEDKLINETGHSASPTDLPESIKKELNKRMIGNSIANSHGYQRQRHNSWDGRSTPDSKFVHTKSTDSNKNSNQQRSKKRAFKNDTQLSLDEKNLSSQPRRFSMAQPTSNDGNSNNGVIRPDTSSSSDTTAIQSPEFNEQDDIQNGHEETRNAKVKLKRHPEVFGSIVSFDDDKNGDKSNSKI